MRMPLNKMAPPLPWPRSTRKTRFSCRQRGPGLRPRGRGSDRAELSILRRDANLDFREVDLGLGDNVKVVGEDIQRDSAR